MIALCIWREARGEPPLGQRAIFHVILNRAKERGRPVEQVILQPKQFSSFNLGEPNSILFPVPRTPDYKVFESICDFITDPEMLSYDITFGALNYLRTDAIPKTQWALILRTRGYKEIVFGAHTFFHQGANDGQQQPL
jgi:hypothetical protein